MTDEKEKVILPPPPPSEGKPGERKEPGRGGFAPPPPHTPGPGKPQAAPIYDPDKDQ